jgi:hypothetical protein
MISARFFKIRVIQSLLILGLFSLFFSLRVQAEGGFGVSGTFAGYHYKLVPGEQIRSENVYASFVNNYSVAIDVQITAEVPNGVELLIESNIVTIPAGQSIRVPVGIRLSAEAVPGDYVVRVSAQVLPGQTEGITLVGSAGLNARLSVFGEAGRIIVRSLTTSGDSFNATIELFRIEEDGRLFSVATAENVLTDRVIAANYVVRSYFQGRTIGERFFTVNNNDNLQIDLIARTVFIRSFTVEPTFFEDRNILASTTVAYSLENIYEVINNIKLDLVVRLDGEVIETQEMFLVPVLNPGRTEGRYTFIPRRGWQAGTYELSILLYEVDSRFEEGQFLYDETSSFVFEVPESIVEGGMNVVQLILLLISGGLFVLLIVFGTVILKDRALARKNTSKLS